MLVMLRRSTYHGFCLELKEERKIRSQIICTYNINIGENYFDNFVKANILNIRWPNL